jgi:hypothetical protein
MKVLTTSTPPLSAAPMRYAPTPSPQPQLTVKTPDPESGVEMNIHVGLCWSVEVQCAAGLRVRGSITLSLMLTAHRWPLLEL